jgi:ankyrin repeat protein
MGRDLSAASRLENLKKEAKRWLKALRANDAGARARFTRLYPNAPAQPGLRDVQHALALEHGLSGWSALKTRLADAAADASQESASTALLEVESFLKNASLDWRVGGSARISAGHTADRLLKRHPDIARHSIYTAVVCGELAAVERLLAGDPGAASRRGGPRDWPPLLYLCSTRLARPAANDNAVAIARALLDRGADPNAWYPGGSESIHYTALTCVFGEGEENAPRHPQFEALTRLLFERGVEPYDIQMLYNTHFHGNILWLLEQMHAQAIRLGRQADWDDPYWSMLDMGGYGCGARYLLNIAVHTHNVELAEWILAHGASPDPPAPENPRASKRTLYEEALRRGQQDMASLLVRHGAPKTMLALEGEEAFTAACFRLERHEADALLQQHPEYLRSTATMFAAARQNRADVVAFLLDLGVSVDVEDANGTRALHEAAYGDAPRVVALLLERGAEVDPRESQYGNTPLGHAVYGRRHRTIELLARVSRDVFELTWIGAIGRLRDVLGAEPGLAATVADGDTLLMWLPDEDARAMEIARLLLALGADASVRNNRGETAADRARTRGLDEVADLLAREEVRARAPHSAPLGWSSAPPFYRIDWKNNTIAPGQTLSERDWDTVLAVMKELGISGLDAGGQMTDGVLARVAQLDHVTRLNLCDSNHVTDAGLLHLARMPQLRDLDVSGWKGQITDRGLDVLRRLPALTRFQMCWQQGVSDVGVANLTSCGHLESVNLLGTPTGDGALRALAAKRKLRYLKSGKLVTDAGLPLLHQFPVFKTWQGGDIRYALMRPDADPNHLLLDGPFTNKGLATLAGLDGLFGLNFFWHISALTAGGLESLVDFANLGMLGCEGKLCNDEAMRHIAAIPRLRMLMAQGTVASDAGFAALSRSQTIEYIWGRECPNLTGTGFAALAAMPALRGLAVSCLRVDEAALSALPRFASLIELMPMDVPDEGFRHVGQCAQLESLWCMYCRDTTDAATEHIAGLSKLKRYYAGSTLITDRSLEILGRMTSLERVILEHCAGITDAGVAHLAGLPRLREITLDGLRNVTREGSAVFPARVRVSYAI